MNKQQVLKILSELKGAYPDAATPIEMADVWLKHLGNYPYDLVENALAYCVRTSPYPPKIADIFKAIEAVKQAGKTLKTPEEAYEEVDYAVRMYGQYGVPRPGGGYDEITWSSPAVEATVKAIGYLRICNTPASQDATLFAQFRDAYNRINTRSREADILIPILADKTPARELPAATTTRDNRKFLV